MDEQIKKEVAAKAAEMADPDYIKRKMLDDLVAQRAAITRKIGQIEAELEAEGARYRHGADEDVAHIASQKDCAHRIRRVERARGAGCNSLGGDNWYKSALRSEFIV